ncbi:MAG: YihY/virulence factor BrkB family protein [Undibacterium sp.]|uniref:YihY/virulence factor BrkB family protein n=1 Tax=Undibacterium sp. TaxID=1914977 RepID=UPI00271FAE0A|nr:YihY/virulence factor BrkB family protein [Undibacterium sp.]MDO8653975.1 YihY/virulence factor BrkB family protein [Undibacterium sp.]
MISTNRPTFIEQIQNVIHAAIVDWINHRAASKGAALAFYTLFSMAPILVLVIAVAGFFYGTQVAQSEIIIQLRGLVGTQGAEAIQLILAGARNHDQGLLATLIATVLLLFGATSVFAELKASLDEIWQIPSIRETGLWDLLRTRLLSFGLILVLTFLMMVSLVVSAVLAVLERYWGGIWKEAAFLLTSIAGLIGFSVIATLFAVIFKMLPRVRLSWHDVAIGALGTAGLFTLGKYAIGLYIGNSGVANSFGAAGSMIALLLWVYYSAQIFFLGAEFTRQYALQMGSLRDSN